MEKIFKTISYSLVTSSVGTIILLGIIIFPLFFCGNINSIKKRNEISLATFVINDEISHQKIIFDKKNKNEPIPYFIKKSSKDARGNQSQDYSFIITPRGKMIGYSSDKNVSGIIVKYLDPKTNFYWNSKNYPVKTRG